LGLPGHDCHFVFDLHVQVKLNSLIKLLKVSTNWKTNSKYLMIKMYYVLYRTNLLL
jgi:hypothetical protein